MERHRLPFYLLFGITFSGSFFTFTGSPARYTGRYPSGCETTSGSCTLTPTGSQEATGRNPWTPAGIFPGIRGIPIRFRFGIHSSSLYPSPGHRSPPAVRISHQSFPAWRERAVETDSDVFCRPSEIFIQIPSQYLCRSHLWRCLSRFRFGYHHLWRQETAR